ncbi:PREDICTED: serine carboxypeptidase-like 3 isoform X2 [Populus euphratica]|uniref:Serine carboxypeptidase-like 3 isoform X2 n=1 Tax=Populus euphratica TaxID=75702 RepID=A0AAJ6T866_POPEU|nr:PREDICTED: serine carboxypeptidase-like 3 isoform X2 [Populus euphratica]
MAKQCLPFLLLLQVWLQLAAARSIVKFLPGLKGPLPFHLETGYVGVDEAEDVQLFYYFIKSQRNPKDDPLLLWLTGGPGCSAFCGLVFEIGPISFEVKEYNGSLPTLVLNPYSWTQVSSIIFLDLPAGTGFSYARTPLALQRSDFKQVSHAEQFLRKWLMDHQEFLANPIYIAGDSYSGKIVPAIVQNISNGNNDGIEPLLNVKGYILGNPITDPTFDFNSRIPFAHGMGLISDELYESLKKSCAGEYQTIKPSNAECLKNVEAFDKCISDIEDAHILERKCPSDAPRLIETLGKRRYLRENPRELLHFKPDLPTIGCRAYGHVLAAYWANDDNVRKALHVREGSIEEWKRCNYKLPYTYEIKSSIKYHIDLGIKGYRRLIYSGDHDMEAPFLGTQAWIRYLNYSVVDDWQPWHYQGQVAGYTRTYSSQLAFATVKGGGHTAPAYRPAECFAMFGRWIVQEHL